MVKKKAQAIKMPLAALYPEAEGDMDIANLAAELAVSRSLITRVYVDVIRMIIHFWILH
jgi:hypothetical protein